MFSLTTSDEKLINKALQGSQRAWVSLVKRHEQRVYNHLLRMTGQQADAFDLMQEVFLAVYRNLPNYRGEGVFIGWVLRVASNRALDQIRYKNRRPEAPLESAGEEWQHSLSDNPAESLHIGQRRAAVLSLLGQLSPDLRLIMELKFFQQCTFDDIAQHMSIPVATAKTRFYTALKQLRGSMEVEDVI